MSHFNSSPRTVQKLHLCLQIMTHAQSGLYFNDCLLFRHYFYDPSSKQSLFFQLLLFRHNSIFVFLIVVFGFWWVAFETNLFLSQEKGGALSLLICMKISSELAGKSFKATFLMDTYFGLNLHLLFLFLTTVGRAADS